MFFLLRPLRLLLKAVTTESTPGQMSFGLALGVLVGLVPKGNLLAVVLGMLLASTRVNLAVAGAAVVAASFASVFLDGLFDRIGEIALTATALQPAWTWLYNQPFVPWTNFNNTIVMGSFLCGLILLWPIHRLSRPVFQRYSMRLAERARKWPLTKLLLGAEWADRMAAVDA
jgi:uncharacterized protein (TIGR03546 family)